VRVRFAGSAAPLSLLDRPSIVGAVRGALILPPLHQPKYAVEEDMMKRKEANPHSSEGGAARIGTGPTQMATASPRAASSRNSNALAPQPSASAQSSHRPAELSMEAPSGSPAASSGPMSASLAPASASAAGPTPSSQAVTSGSGGGDAATQQHHGHLPHNGASSKRHIRMDGGVFAAEPAEIDTFLTSRNFASRARDFLAHLSSGKRRGEVEGKREAASDGAAHFEPSVSQVRVSTYQRLAYGTNRIQSARYTPITFLPLNLWEQIAPWCVLALRLLQLLWLLQLPLLAQLACTSCIGADCSLCASLSLSLSHVCRNKPANFYFLCIGQTSFHIALPTAMSCPGNAMLICSSCAL
jgi:hypothetical protein